MRHGKKFTFPGILYVIASFLAMTLCVLGNDDWAKKKDKL